MGIKAAPCSDKVKVILGSLLLDAYCESCGSFYKTDFYMKNKKWYSRDKQKSVQSFGSTIRPTPETIDWFLRNHDRCKELAPVLKPMVVPPKDWVDPWNGGYIKPSLTAHNSSCRFIRRVSNSWLKENMDDIDPQVYEAVNRVQATPYRVNTKVLAVMRQLTGSGLAGLPDGRTVDELVPPKLTPQEAADPKRLKNHKIQCAEIYSRHYKEVSQKTAHMVRMRLADMFKDQQAIWFPMNLDWRGRLFTMSSPFMSPQGDDPAKGLLEFAEGKEITAEGFVEMQIHGANVWCEKNHGNILEVAADPMGAIREWWCAADKPFQFLAFCFDYASYMENRSHKSHLICAIDATCSGLQHWSAVLADEDGAGRVGMIPKPTPDDIYQAVADRVEERIKRNDDPIAVAWRGKVTRTITKRNVMTKLYGATLPGMRDQVHTELEKLDKKNGSRYLDGCPVDNYKAADFISRENDAAMRDIIAKATEGMDFVQSVARQLAKAGKPTSWKSPVGLPIDQTYWQTRTAKVHTYWLSVKVPQGAYHKKRGGGKEVQLNVSYAAPEKGIQERKAANSIAPNFIHSMDASHLMFISLGWNKAFTPIHDSFGTHASDLAELGKVVRETFIKMYDGWNYLSEFYKGNIRRYPDVELAEFLPDRGQFNFNNIKEATYFCR
jgi:DNA-directed RNA polymerase